MNSLIGKLKSTGTLSKSEFIELIGCDKNTAEELRKTAEAIRDEYYGHGIFIRGLIEFSNYCRQDCLYCGIRRSNKDCSRYRLTEDEILSCCREGYALGFRTFVLQGGEDPYFNDDRMSAIIDMIKSEFPDCALTLSLGEKSYDSYKRFYDAGADRYLLRHETANAAHYARLHPASQTLDNRKKCLYDLKKIGYQVGCGFMVGSPYQTAETLADDLLFISELKPQMVGIGPFIHHSETPFRDFSDGTLEQTLLLLSIIRIMLPAVLLPATTALATIHPKGRELGILAGANVVMPNLSPLGVRKNYQLYDNKVCTGDESAQCKLCLEKRMEAIGFHIVTGRGDPRQTPNNTKE